MPLLARTDLPALSRLAGEGLAVVRPGDWDGPVLRVGLVNAMDDGAVEATERQWLRLLAAAAPGHGVELLPCGLPEVPRGPRARGHCDAHYLDLPALRAARPHAVIVTGANVAEPDLDRLHCRASLVEVIAWAEAEAPRALYSCLATHAVLQFRHGHRRRALPAKRWGVYPHRLLQPVHPLLAGLRDGLRAPHSRWNEVPADGFAGAGLDVLVVDVADGGVHVAASRDGRQVYLQGHPEYDPVSLPKEHKREVARFWAGHRPDCPAAPENIADAAGGALLAAHRDRVLATRARGEADLPPYPEAALRPHLRDDWRGDTARLLAAWLRGT